MYSLAIRLFKLAVKYPKLFFENISFHNFNRLVAAVKNESLSDIFSNMDSYFSRAKQIDVKTTFSIIDNFIAKIPRTHKRYVLIVSHEATFTGAPMIIKQYGALLKSEHETQPIFLIIKGGEFEREFKKIGPTYLLEDFTNNPHMNKEMDYIVRNLTETFSIEKAYINSAESFPLLIPCRKYIKTVVSLIHELGTYYPKGNWKNFDDNSDIIVFPANFVKERAFENFQFKKAKLVVRGQGLLKPEIVKENKKENSTKLRKMLGIDPNATIILSCGTPIARKGIDLFVLTAIAVLAKFNKKEKPYFVWLGDAPNNDHLIWARRDILQSGNANHILLVGNKLDTIPYFVGSDIFYMTSKGDPFPCVIHEALAAGLHIVGFENSGGYTEIITEESGEIFKYGDVVSVAQHLIKRIRNPKATAYKPIDIEDEIFSMNKYTDFLINL